jgi:hypothetical protein
MLILPRRLVIVIGAFAPMFSQRVFAHAKRLMIGAILAPGKRTVTAVLRVMGNDNDRHFQNYHCVLNRARWPALRGGRILLRLLVRAFVPTGPVVIGIDETIERRRGEQIATKGIYWDPVRSSHAHFVKASGMRWVSLMLLAPIPWTSRIWALPFLTVLSPSERYYQQEGRPPQTLLDRARQAVWLVRRWLPERELVVVGDRTYAALEWLDVGPARGVCHHPLATRRGALRARSTAHAQTERPAAQKGHEAADAREDLDQFDDPLEDSNDASLVRRRRPPCPDYLQHGRLVPLG